MNTYLENNILDFEGVETFLKKEISSLRIGRANPSMVENILVDSYGVKTPLSHIASIASPDARSITIQPWDKGVMKNIEKGIVEANIGLAGVNEGNIIRITLPQLTQEDRKNLVKILHQKLEHAKIKLRLIRDKVREEIQEAEKNNEITEDDKFSYLKEADEFTKKNNDSVDTIIKNKEKEIMEI